MVTVHFGLDLQRFTGEQVLSLQVADFPELVEALLERYPSLPRADLLAMSIAIDGEIIHSPLLESLPAGADVHFLPRISGG